MANTNFTFDFGFSAVDEDELEVLQSAQAEIASASSTNQVLEDKLNKLYNMVQPLLNNLKANPEKDYIYWPNRLTKVEQFQDALDEVYKS